MKKRALEITVIALVIALGILLVGDIGYMFRIKYVSAFAAMEEADRYEVRSRLLMDAMNSVGVCGPEEAARLWAEGLKGRSGAGQYAAMTKELKARYAEALDRSFQNWVTGGSSPWVQSYEVSETAGGGDSRKYLVRFHLVTSTGPAGDYDARLTVAREGPFWRVSQIDTDRELDPYTGFLDQCD